MAAIAGSIGMIGIARIRMMHTADLELYNLNTAPQPVLAHLSVTFLKIRIALRDLLAADTLDQREKAMGEIEDFTSDLDRSIAEYDLSNLSPKERALFDKFTGVRQAYADLQGTVVAAAMAGTPREGWRILRSRSYAKIRNIVLGSLEEIEQMKVVDAQEASDTNTALATVSAEEMLIAMALGVLLALGAGMALTLSITRPIEQVVRVLVAVAEGDLSQRLEIGSDDEIGQLSKTLNWTIAELQKTREDLIGAREKAQAASQAKSEFLSSMSHEIRTPMNAVLGMGELLAETELNSEQRRFLSVMNSNGESLLELINSILDLAKIESGRLQIESTAFDLNDLVDKLLATFGSRSHIKGLALAARIAPGVPQQLVGDPFRLRQILVNLIGNALKFTDVGEVILAIERDPEANEPGRLRFTVSDTGIGIPPNKVEAVFSSFTQVDSSTTRKYGGTGLGLAIAQRLVGLMEGRIWVESEIGIGSKFIFTANFGLAPATLEIDADGVPASATGIVRFAELASVSPQLEGELPAVRILVAEDSADNRLVISAFLRRTPCQIDFAENGEIAVDKFIHDHYDLVLRTCRCR